MRNLIIALFLCLSPLVNAQPIKVEGPGPNWEWHQTDKYHGSIVVIVSMSRYTEREAREVNWSLTRLGGVKLFTIVDFAGIPHFLYNYARHRIIRKIRRSEVICDFDQRLSSQLNTDPRHRVDIIVLNKDGEIRGHFKGAVEINSVIKLIDELAEK